jgi:hypothetical protein
MKKINPIFGKILGSLNIDEKETPDELRKELTGKQKRLTLTIRAMERGLKALKSREENKEAKSETWLAKDDPLRVYLMKKVKAILQV